MTQSLSERLSTLSLPELSRDDISRGLSGIHVPDLGDIERPTIDLPEIDLPKVDISKAVLSVATAVGLSKPARPRWQFALGAAALLAVGAVIAVNRRALMIRLDSAVHAAKRQVAQTRWGQPGDEPVAFTAAPTAPIQPSETTGDTGADYPDGLGNGSGRAFSDVEDRGAEVVGV